MCGFVGSFGGALPTDESLEKITTMITHRGPDAVGYYKDDFIKLGFRRLSIIDLENGHQPLSYENHRYIIIFNGEIYNHVEIRDRLKKEGLSFETESDTEVILALYSIMKEDAVKELRGMFAFVIWDKQEQEIFAARDHFGIKPFFYIIINDTLFMASEAKSIYDKKEELEVNVEYLQHYLTFQYYPEPQTVVKSIQKLEPGHYIKQKVNGKMEIKAYWQPHFAPSKDSYEYQKDKILETLRDSVRIHMRSDVPVGSFLSGGIDSTAIVALAREVNPKIKTFSVGFEQDGFSEIDVAKETAEALNVENIDYIISPEEYLQELPKIIWHMDEPMADPAAVPLYFVAREASKHVTVVLSGEGSDELFGGYNIYREPQSLKPFSYVPDAGKKMLHSIAKQLPDGMKGKSFIERGSTPIEERYFGNAKIMTEEEKASFLYTYNKKYPSTEMTKRFYDQIKDYDDVRKMQFIDMHTWLRGDILVKADKMTMAHSLELRVPFLDKEVFRIASQLQTDYKIANGTTKYILRDALKQVVPEHIFMRKKLGFPVPIRHWLKNEWYEWAVQLIQTSETDYLFNKSYLLNMLEAHKNNKGDYSRKLWTVFIFMIWHQIYIEKKINFADKDSKETLAGFEIQTKQTNR
ncbi:asparagine synthase (glutamine-hydrolyzing) [Evansella sp. AB-rgal1]|uniref:asparagine synthase (glutamine-hydrolyzing) n=1 Tax=Evansella sp. AB-rgal1 TaxID=3242696 RepID=UPI00359EBFDA